MTTTTRPGATVRVTSRLPGGYIDGIQATISILNQHGVRIGERVVTTSLGGFPWPIIGNAWSLPVTEIEADAVWGALDLLEMHDRPL